MNTEYFKCECRKSLESILLVENRQYDLGPYETKLIDLQNQLNADPLTCESQSMVVTKNFELLAPILHDLLILLGESTRVQYLANCLNLKNREIHLKKLFSILRNLFEHDGENDWCGQTFCIERIQSLFTQAIQAKIKLEIGVSFGENKELQDAMKEHDRLDMLNRLLISSGFDEIDLAKDEGSLISFKQHNSALEEKLKFFFSYEHDSSQTVVSLRSEILSKFKRKPSEIQFDGESPLGEGGFGKVYLGKYKSMRIVAIKTFKQQDVRDVENEILSSMLLGTHPNVTKLLGYADVNSTFLIAFEWAKYGSLASIVFAKEAYPSIPPMCLLKWLLDVMKALEHVHSKNIRHGDIKAENILLYQGFTAKLCDFGLSKQVFSMNANRSSLGAGSYGFIAPEIINGYQGNKSADVFSFAMMVYQVVVRKYPVVPDRKAQIDSIFANTWASNILTQKGSALMRALLHKCIVEDISARPTASAIIQTMNVVINTLADSSGFDVDNPWKASQLTPFLSQLDAMHPIKYLNNGDVTDANIQFHKALNLWFSDRSAALAEYGHISYWDTSNVTDMSRAFKGRSDFNDNIQSWNVSNVITMEEMFCDAVTFNQPLSAWNVSNVKSMNSMFRNAKTFNQSLATWDMTNVIDFREMLQDTASFSQLIFYWKINPEIDVSFIFGAPQAILDMLQDETVPQYRRIHALIRVIMLSLLYVGQDRMNDALSLLQDCENVRETLTNWTDSILSTIVLVDGDSFEIKTKTILAHLLFWQSDFSLAMILFADLFKQRNIRFGDCHECSLNIQFSIAQVLLQQGQLDKALQSHSDCLAKRRNVLGEVNRFTFQSMCAVAYLYSLQGRCEFAECMLDGCYAMQKRLLGVAHIDTMITVLYQSRLCILKGEFKQSLDLAQQSLTDNEVQLCCFVQLKLQFMYLIALCHYRLDDLPLALTLIREVLTEQNKILGDDHIDSVESRVLLGEIGQHIAELAAHEYDDLIPFGLRPATETNMSMMALELFTSCLALTKMKFGLYHRSTTKVAISLAKCYQHQGCLKEAKALLMEFVLYETEPQCLDDTIRCLIKSQLAEIAFQEKQFMESLTLLNDVRTLMSKHYGETHIETVRILIRIGDIYACQKDYDKAMAFYSQANSSQRYYLKDSHSERLLLIWKQAELYRSTMKSDNTIALYMKYLSVLRNAHGSMTNHIWSAMLKVALYMKELEQYEEALLLLEECLAFITVQSQTVSPNDRKASVVEIKLALVRVSLADIYYMKHDHENALQLYNDSIPLLRSLLDSTNKDDEDESMKRIKCYVMKGLYNIGIIYKSNDLHENAVNSFQDAYAMALACAQQSTETSDGANKERLFMLECLYELGIMYKIIGKHDTARFMLLDCCNQRKTILGETHEDTLAAKEAFDTTLSFQALKQSPGAVVNILGIEVVNLWHNAFAKK